MELEPERVKVIDARLHDGYYLQHWAEAVSDMMVLLKLYRGAAKREHKYWEAANKAELELEAIKEVLRDGTNEKG
jgi:hypothetical protein